VTVSGERARRLFGPATGALDCALPLTAVIAPHVLVVPSDELGSAPIVHAASIATMSATLVDEAAFGSTPTSATFTSAFRAAPHGRDPSASARRRRGSESTTSSTAPAAGARALGHARSHTEDHTNGRHPLRSPTPGPSIPRGRVMPGDATRPRLQRVLSSDMDVTARADTWEHEEPRADKSVERSDGSSRARDEETVVLVHQVRALLHALENLTHTRYTGHAQ
jgi:hypothetical protein